jgi:hypothetical protein
VVGDGVVCRFPALGRYQDSEDWALVSMEANKARRSLEWFFLVIVVKGLSTQLVARRTKTLVFLRYVIISPTYLYS